MFRYKKSLVFILILTLFFSLSNKTFAASEPIILTGNLYTLQNGVYTLEIPDIDGLMALNGKQLGFKVATQTHDDKDVIYKETEILGVRCLTDKKNSNIIFNAIQKMLVPNNDNKILTLTIGASGSNESYDELVRLLSLELSHKRENILVEYVDNRVDGDGTSTVKVIYKIGSDKTSSSGSDFVVSNISSFSSDDIKTTQKSANSSNSANLEKINTSKILAVLKDNKSAKVNLNDKSDTLVPKRLLSELMYDKYKDKEIVFEKYIGSQMKYRWKMSVSGIYVCEKFDMNVTFDNPEVSQLLKDKLNHFNMISFSHNGMLPASCNLEVPMDLTGFEINKLNVLTLNLETKKIEKKNISFQFKDGSFIMTTGFGGIYIITDQEV